MADPTASFVLTARDSTGAALKSADRNFRSLLGSVRSARSVFASFGVALTGRAFLNWIDNAVKAAEVTASSSKELRTAKEAIDHYNTASQDLAVTIGSKLAPAYEAAARSLEGWRKALAPSELEATQAALRDTYATIATLNADLDKARTPRGFLSDLFFGQNEGEILEKLEAAKRLALDLLDRVVAAQKGGATGWNPLPDINQDEWVKLESFLYEMNHQKPKLRELTVEMTGFIDQVKRGAEITASMQTDLEKNLETWRETMELSENGIIGPETVTRVRDSLLEPIEVTAKRIKELKPEVSEFTKSLGRGLHDSLVDFIVDGELQFKDFLRRMAAEFAVSEIFSFFGSALTASSGGSGVAGFFGKMFGGARAGGGPVSSGRAYLVGENGPEMFVPGQNGSIAANGGGVVNNIQVDARGSQDPAAIEAAVGRAVAIATGNTANMIRGLYRPGMA